MPQENDLIPGITKANISPGSVPYCCHIDNTIVTLTTAAIHVIMIGMSVGSNRYGTLVDFSRILRLFEDQDVEGLGVRAIARAVDASPSKVSRMLQTLQGEGLMNRDLETGKYWLGARLCRIGLVQLLSQPLRPVLLPHLEQMTRESGFMASWGTGSQGAGMTLTIDRIGTSISGDVVHLMGALIPYFASSYGRVFLAYMNEEQRNRLLEDAQLLAYTSRTITSMDELKRAIEPIVAQGYAIDDGQAIEGLEAVSVPILNRECELCAVINLSGYEGWTESRRAKVLSYLVEKGSFISRQFGYPC